MKIYFDTQNNNFAGAENISSEYTNSETLDFIEIESNDWMLFLENNNGKQIKVVNGELIAEDFILTLEQQKQSLINVRKQYLQDTDWYIVREIDEPKSCPKDIKNKRILARKEINEIEVANEETINNYSPTF